MLEKVRPWQWLDSCGMGDGAHKKQEQQHNIIKKTRSEGGGRRRWYVGGGKGKEVKKG